MTDLWARIVFVKLRNLWTKEEGQDLVEYALVVALVAFGAISGVRWLSDQIDSLFFTLATWLQADVPRPH